MKFTTKEIILLALFAAVWAVIEINLGLLLKIIKLPFYGTILTFIGLLILVLARTTVPKRGTAILMGICVAFLKLIYLGGIAIYPVIGILMEVILVEIVFQTNKHNKRQIMTASIMAISWSLLHLFFVFGILAGWGFVRVFELIVERGASLLGIAEHQALLIFFVILLFHLIIGILGGLLNWKLKQMVFKRLPNFQMFEA